MRPIAMKLLGVLLLSSLGACYIGPGPVRYESDGPYGAAGVDCTIDAACNYNFGYGYGRGYSCYPYRAFDYGTRRPGQLYMPSSRPGPSHSRGGTGESHQHGTSSQGSHSQGSHGGHR
jgi:hypothetical protein